MNYDVEPWYKLYIRESTEDKVLPVLNRALRDHLLRYAKSRDDATILGSTENPSADLARALGAHADELELIVGFVDSMLADHYLTHRKRRLFITNFVKAQEARSPGARRQKTYRKNHPPARNGKSTGDGGGDGQGVTVGVTGDVTSNGGSNDEKRRDEESRDETRRGETTPARPPGDFGIPLTTQDDELRDDWLPSQTNVDLAAKLGLNNDDELAKYRAHRKRSGYRCGNWDADYELWLRKGKEFARERAATRGTKTHGGPSDDWPTDADLSLREAIRGGAHGDKLKAKLEAGQLDAGLARRLVREREDEIRDNREVRALTATAGRPMP